MMRGIDNVGICTADLPRSVAFYQRLGFSGQYRNERGVLKTNESVRLFLFATRKPNPPSVGRELGLFDNPPDIGHVSFAVADVDTL
jgi:catechol 2,3-dioxygenase-like lactoylglutathione lyase family enzyme